jgi:hypothetical protein
MVLLGSEGLKLREYHPVHFVSQLAEKMLFAILSNILKRGQNGRGVRLILHDHQFQLPSR